MLGRQEEVIRVGVRLVVVAAVIGLMVLLFYGTARSQELAVSDSALGRLVSPVRPTAQERVAEAQSWIREDRRRRLSATYRTLVRVGWQAVGHASPRRLLHSIGELGGHIRSWRWRSAAEDRALDLLEAELASGCEDPELRDLYAHLRERERRERFERTLGEVEDAAVSGDLRLARRRLERARELNPDSPRLEAVDLALKEQARQPATRVPAAGSRPIRMDPQGPRAGALLLAAAYDALPVAAEASADARLAAAVASALAGQSSQARDQLEALAGSVGPAGRLARRWLEDPPPGLLVAETSLASVSESGSADSAELSLRGIVRGLAGWLRPRQLLATLLPAPRYAQERAALRGSARAPSPLPRPDRALRRRVRGWLGNSRGGEARADRAWDDARLQLPAARTRYSRVSPPAFLATRDALAAVLGPGLDSLPAELSEARTVLLRVVSDPEARVRATTVPAPRALIDALARGVETGAVHGQDLPEGEILRGLRRLDAALEGGATLAVAAWQAPEQGLLSALRKTGMSGDPTRVRDVKLRRHKRGMVVSQSWTGLPLECPAETYCLGRARRFEGMVYSRIDLSADIRVGARTSFQRASLAFQIDRSGPRASVVLPFAAWLGLGRWLPAHARIDLGLDGISFEPRYGSPL